MAFRCTVVTPEGQMFDDTVSDAIVPAHDGLIGFQSNHAPTLLRIGSGPLTLKGSGKSVTYFIDGGVAQMAGDALTILTDSAIDPAKIDAADAKQALEEAIAMVPASEGQRTIRDRKMRKARAALRIKGMAG
jgi:ATP synthase F1 epsilon subunit